MKLPRRATRYIHGSGIGPTLVRAALGSSGLRILGMAFSFLVGVQLARGLGADGYGVYGLAMSVTALLSVPTQFGIPQLLTREIARARAANDWEAAHAVLTWANRTVVLSAAGIAALAVPIILFWSRRESSELISTVKWGLLLVPLVALANVRGAALRGGQRIVLGQVPELAIRPAVFSLLIFIAIIGVPSLAPSTAMALHAAAALVALAAATWFLRTSLPRISSAPLRTFGQGQRWFRSAFPLALTEGMRMLQGHMSILLLGAFSTDAAVGWYRVALSTIGIIAIPVTLLNVVTAPVVAKYHAESERSKLQETAPVVALFMTAGVGCLTVPFLVKGEWLLGTAFGSEFEPALPCLLLLSAGQLMNGLFGINTTLLNMTGHEQRTTRAFGAAVALEVTLALSLIPYFGAAGAAGASLVGLLAWNLLTWADARRILQIDSCALAAWRNHKNHS